MSFELTGMQELLDKVELLGKKADAAANNALKKGAEIFETEIQSRAPKSDVPRKPTKKQRWRTGDHAYKLLEAGKIQRDGSSKYVMTGVQEDDNSKIFYLKFHEFGTSKLRARPFIEPSFESKKDEVTETVKNELGKGLDLFWT